MIRLILEPGHHAQTSTDGRTVWLAERVKQDVVDRLVRMVDAAGVSLADVKAIDFEVHRDAALLLCIERPLRITADGDIASAWLAVP